MCTSGSTGTPKGVELTQSAYASACADIARWLNVNHSGRLFSYLPLAYIAERVVTEVTGVGCINYPFKLSMIGNISSVSTVATVRPNTITTAIDAKNASENSGIIPSMVVVAAIETGRTRDTDAATTASNAPLLPSACTFISSTNTIPFLSSIPIRLKLPSSAMNVKGAPTNTKPPIMPIVVSGITPHIANA